MQIKHRIDLIKLLPSAPITCEVGVAQGLFSRDICHRWKPSKHYCVDAWQNLSGTGDGNFPQEWHDMNYYTARWNMYNYRDKVQFVKGISWEVAKDFPDFHFDLIYLDANHSREAVEKDLHAWYRKLKVGGVMAGHDYINRDYGVFEAANQFVRRSKVEINLIPEDKDEDAGFYFIKRELC